MLNFKIYQVDAFADRLFSGNPAAIVPLESFVDVKLMQQIAMENNLAETAFFCPSVKPGIDYDIRWFTPAVEINLCGHATLASAWVLFNILNFPRKEVVFHSESGPLTVTNEGLLIVLDFPSWEPVKFDDYPVQLKSFLGGVEIVSVYKYRDLVVELASEEAVKNCMPDFAKMKESGYKVIITAQGNSVDFVSRFFAPTVGIDEDPATGSSHSQLIPFWARKLNKTKMIANQLSKRGAQFTCEQLDERVKMGGHCIFYMKGEITILEDQI